MLVHRRDVRRVDVAVDGAVRRGHGRPRQPGVGAAGVRTLAPQNPRSFLSTHRILMLQNALERGD